MKVALRGNQLLIKDMNAVQFSSIKSWNRMKYDRKSGMMVGIADAELLDLLAQLIPLTEKLEAERTRLHSLQSRVDAERMKDNPTPLIPMPIKAKPYAHQIRGYNMALMVFDLA